MGSVRCDGTLGQPGHRNLPTPGSAHRHLESTAETLAPWHTGVMTPRHQRHTLTRHMLTSITTSGCNKGYWMLLFNILSILTFSLSLPKVSLPILTQVMTPDVYWPQFQHQGVMPWCNKGYWKVLLDIFLIHLCCLFVFCTSLSVSLPSFSLH